MQLQLNHKIRHVAIAAGIVCALGSGRVFGQSLDLDLGRAREMLQVVKDDVKKNYYDPAYHGMDLDARFSAAEQEMRQARSAGYAFGSIAQVLLDLDDSHTFFLPPSRRARVDYGWQPQMIGNKCYVMAVRPGSDAEAKGLKPGDEVRAMDRFTPARDNLWKIHYLYYSLRPKPGMRLQVTRPTGESAELEVMAKIEEHKQVLDLTKGEDFWQLIRELENEDRLERHRYFESGEDLIIWKMPSFDLDDSKLESIMGRVNKHKALILDLRGNGGGAVSTLLALLGYFFDSDTTIGEMKSRKASKPMIAKMRHGRRFVGQTLVLVDSASASAAEIFAREMQLGKRAAVIGDRSAGAVMVCKYFPHHLGLDTQVFYGVSITEADLVMSDGKSLERVGVQPDELLLPTAADLAASRDPVLSRAAARVGVSLDPGKAGQLFPIEWRK